MMDIVKVNYAVKCLFYCLLDEVGGGEETDSAHSRFLKHGWKLRTGSTALGGDIISLVCPDKLFITNTVNCTFKPISQPAVGQFRRLKVWPSLK